MGFLKSKNIPDGVSTDSIFDRSYQYAYLRVGKIINIDYNRNLITIEWVTGRGHLNQLPITYAYAGPRGCIGGAPEPNSYGVFFFLNEGGNRGTTPLLLSYLPAGYDLGVHSMANKVNPDAMYPEQENELRYRFRNLEYGDVIVASPEGGQGFFNKDVQLLNESLNEILMRASDQAIVSTSLNNHIFAAGVSINSGLITRNSMILLQDGKRIPLTNAREVTLLDGREVIYIIPDDEKITVDSEIYNEYRIAVEEKSTGTMNYNDTNQAADGSPSLDPIIEFVLGTMVGGDRRDLKNYGKILKPVLFSSPYDRVGSYSLTQARNMSVDEQNRIALAYAIKAKAGTLLGVDKEGHYYVHLSRSSASNPLGSGRSMSVLAQGNLKEIWGPDSEMGAAWDLTAKGGIRWLVGSHNINERNRSIDIEAEKSIHIRVLSTDMDGIAKQEDYNGQVITNITGNDAKSVTGNYQLDIQGLKKERIFGAASEHVYEDKSVVVGGVLNETAKERQVQLKERTVTISNGDDELKILKGDRKETLLFGNRKTTLTKGDIEERIIVGDRKVNIGKGDYTVFVGAGNVRTTATAGTISANTTKSISLRAGTGVSTISPKTNLRSASVGLGLVPVSPVTSTLTHNCYITGIPPRGSFSVKSSV